MCCGRYLRNEAMVRRNCCLTDSMDQIPVQNALLVHYRNVFLLFYWPAYLRHAFFIGLMYTETCTDLNSGILVPLCFLTPERLTGSVLCRKKSGFRLSWYTKALMWLLSHHQIKVTLQYSF